MNIYRLKYAERTLHAAFLKVPKTCRYWPGGLRGNCDLGPSCEKDCMACIVKWLYAKTKHGKNNG